VDSSVGGKTGINLRQGKNLVGAFWHPRFVICDTGLLATLSRRQMAAGLAEVVKYACIARPSLLHRIESSFPAMLGPERHVDPALVAACVRIKAAVVGADEREADRRRILNFGHTYGHALERAVEHPPLLHGEAVALGMLVALELSVRAYPQSPDLVRDVYGLLRAIFPRLEFPSVPWRRVSPYLARDKKVSGRATVWVLLRRLGQPVMTEVRAARTIQSAVAVATARWNGR
jgi:3-dehydroquinate synthase